MQARIRVCCAAAVLALALALAGSAGAQPIDFFLPIPNPVFADPPGNDYVTTGQGTFDRTSDSSFPGGHSLRIVTSQPAGSLARWMTRTNAVANACTSPGFTGCTVPLAGLEIVVNAEFRLTGVDHGHAELALTYWNAQQQYLGRTDAASQGGNPFAPLTGTTGWVTVFAAGVAPAGTAFVRIEFRLYGPGALLVDHVSGLASPIFPPITFLVPPSISGSAVVGETLEGTPGLPDAPPNDLGFPFFVWMRCDAAGASCLDIIGGSVLAGFDRYTLVPADVGHRIRLRVSVSSFDSSGSAVSGPTDVVTEATDGNLVPDPRLESGPAPFYYTAGSGVFSWATDQSHSPTHALKLVSNQPSGQTARWMTRIQAVPVTPGRSYTAAAFVRTASVSAGNVHLVVTFWTAGQSYVPVSAVDSGALSGTNDWMQLAAPARAPAGSAFMRLEIRLSGPGAFWADDLVVVPTP